MMRESDYAEAVGYLRVLEKRLLTASGLDRVLDAPSAQEAMKLLTQNSDYDFSAVKRPEDYESVMRGELRKTYDLLYHISPNKALVDLLAAKYDYHNVKIYVKAKYRKKEADSGEADDITVQIGSLEPQVIKNAVNLQETKELPEHIINAIAKAEESFENQAQHDPQDIDLAVDKEMFAYMTALAQEVGSDYVIEYVKNIIDFYNLKTLLRVKNMQKGTKFLRDALMEGGQVETNLFVENYDKSLDMVASNFFYKYFGGIIKSAVEAYDKTGNFSALEKLTDNYVMEHVKKSKYVAFGPEPLFAYILAKENEIRQVRIVMACKINAIPNAVARERLRDNYA